MMLVIDIRDINPIPWKAPEGSIGRAGGGKPFVRFHSPAEMTNFKNAIRDCITQAYPALFNNGPVFPKGTPLYVEFHYWRRLDTWVTEKGRNQTARRTDVTNMNKLLEDALQEAGKREESSFAGVYANDVDNVMVAGLMEAQGTDVESRIVIAVSDRPPHAPMSPLGDDFMSAVHAPMPPGNVRIQYAHEGMAE